MVYFSRYREFPVMMTLLLKIETCNKNLSQLQHVVANFDTSLPDINRAEIFLSSH